MLLKKYIKAFIPISKNGRLFIFTNAKDKNKDTGIIETKKAIILESINLKPR
ncbi:MAG: hypothetical protein ORN26_00435 [Candidatus Pacebacteria bacterium]|nr:hypothetical protein [Candidatus Paceibacterota bacterium]